MGIDVVLVEKPFADDHIEHGVEERYVATGRETHAAPGIGVQRLAPGINDDQFGAVACCLLEVGSGDRVIHRRVAAGQNHHVCLERLHEGGGYGPGPQALHQRRDGAGVAKPGAMVHMVGAETGAHQLLEQPGFFVGALGAAEAGERIRSVLCFKLGQSVCRKIQRLFPAGLSKMR